ncbi:MULTISPECIES: nitroreductase family protein [unclassified Spiroplasma]|uniref:nitroreductase family protein n=1 Tax=unclassified Spiroplasma TaxID=2637901 RepID=UPI0030CF6F09
MKKEDLNLILNAGRLAPSALGSEPTRILAIRNNHVKEKLAEISYDEPNWKKVKTTDVLILFVSVKGDILNSKTFIKNRLDRWGLPEDQLEDRVDSYLEYLKQFDCDSYSINKAFISAAYMSLQAASIEVYSTIMQGFNLTKLNDCLNKKGYINKEKESVHLSMAIGLSNKELKNKIYPQVQLSSEELYTLID